MFAILPSQTGYVDTTFTHRAWEFATTRAPTLPPRFFKRQNDSGDGDEGEICGLGLTDPDISFQCASGFTCTYNQSFSAVECCSLYGDVAVTPPSIAYACSGGWAGCIPLASSTTFTENTDVLTCNDPEYPYCQTFEWIDLSMSALQCGQNYTSINMIADPLSSSTTSLVTSPSATYSVFTTLTNVAPPSSSISASLATISSPTSFFSSISPTQAIVPSDQTSSPSSSSAASTTGQKLTLFSSNPASAKTGSSSVAPNPAKSAGVHNQTAVIISAVVSGTLGSIVILAVTLLCLRYWRRKRAAVAAPVSLIISRPTRIGSPSHSRRHSKIEPVAGVPPEMLMRNPAIEAFNLSSQEYQQLSPRELSYVNSIAMGPDGQPYGREYCELPA